jgi:hypothetical protein
MGVTADNGGFWLNIVCPLMTQSGHRTLLAVLWISYNAGVIRRHGGGAMVRLVSIFAFAVMLTYLGIVPGHAEKREACKHGYVHNEAGECVREVAKKPAKRDAGGDGNVVCNRDGCRTVSKNCHMGGAGTPMAPVVCD